MHALRAIAAMVLLALPALAGCWYAYYDDFDDDADVDDCEYACENYQICFASGYNADRCVEACVDRLGAEDFEDDLLDCARCIDSLDCGDSDFVCQDECDDVII